MTLYPDRQLPIDRHPVWGWVVDLLVGWLAGSFVVSVAVDVVASFAGVNDHTHASLMTFAAGVGTVAGIVLMRWLRHRSEIRSYRDIQ